MRNLMGRLHSFPSASFQAYVIIDYSVSIGCLRRTWREARNVLDLDAFRALDKRARVDSATEQRKAQRNKAIDEIAR